MCEILLKHHLGNDAVYVPLLMLAVNKGVAKQIRDLSREKLEKQYESLLHQLSSGTDLTAEEAAWIIQTWIIGFQAQPKTPAQQPVEKQKVEKLQPVYDPGAWTADPPPLHVKEESDDLLFWLLLAGLAIHLITSILVVALGEFMLPKKAKKDEIFMGLLIAYGVTMIFSMFVCLLAFMLVNLMYKKNEHVSTNVTLRFFATWIYSSGAVYVAFLLTFFMPIYVSIWLTLGFIAWTIQYFGFRIFVTCFVLFSSQWLVIFLLPQTLVGALFLLGNPPAK